MITLAEENYLKAILSISLNEDGKVSTNAIAKEISTSAASVSDMLKKLQDKKLIKYKKYKGVELMLACHGNSIGNFNASSYQWIFGDGFLDSTVNPIHQYPIDSDGLGVVGLYQDLLIVTDLNGCSDTAVNIIWVRDEYWIYIPNSFTPDNDNINDRLCIEYNGIREETFILKIFNKQGDLMYQSQNPSELKCRINGGWDGKHIETNNDLPSDFYVSEIYFQDFEGWKYHEFGYVILVR